MRIEMTERFRCAFRSLEEEDARRVEKALRLLADNPRQPGLRVKKMQGWPGLWEARASDSLRLTFEIHGDAILLRNVGAHDDALRNP